MWRQARFEARECGAASTAPRAAIQPALGYVRRPLRGRPGSATIQRTHGRYSTLGIYRSRLAGLGRRSPRQRGAGAHEPIHSLAAASGPRRRACFGHLHFAGSDHGPKADDHHRRPDHHRLPQLRIDGQRLPDPIETIDGPTPGLTISTTAPLSSSTVSHNIGFEFRATAGSNDHRGCFGHPERRHLLLAECRRQRRRRDRPGRARRRQHRLHRVRRQRRRRRRTIPTPPGTITGGPVNTFRFDFDMFLTPASGVTATYGSTTFLFDLAGDEPPAPTLPADSTACNISPPTPT